MNGCKLSRLKRLKAFGVPAAVTAFALCLALSLAACSGMPSAHAAAEQATDTGSSATAETDSADATKAKAKTVDLVAVGDDLIHSNIISSARTSSGYNFDKMFSKVKKYVKAADIAVINQETIFTNGDYSGYPAFGSPKKVGDAIAKCGFDVVTQATNHVMDRGTGAIKTTLKFWKKKHPEIKVLGIHTSKKDASKIQVIKKNGIKIALLNYTYGTNGISVPSGKKYMVDMLTSSNKAKIKKDIKRAKKKSDFVIVFPHWGTEYRLTPDSSQKSWAKFFAKQGVDLVIGAHPHVIEPVKKVKGKNGKKMVCFYSLGNFVSNQYFSTETLLGGMARVRIVKDAKGTRVKSYAMDGLVTHIARGSSSYKTYKLDDYTPALARKNNIHRRAPGETFTVKRLKSILKKVTGN